jgi:hypothetical protein
MLRGKTGSDLNVCLMFLSVRSGLCRIAVAVQIAEVVGKPVEVIYDGVDTGQSISPDTEGRRYGEA